MLLLIKYIIITFMIYAKFKEIIESTPLLNDEYKKNLLEEAKDYNPELLEKIVIIVYNRELKFIDDVNELKKENKNKIIEEIKRDETAEKIEAEEEIDKLLNFNF